DYNDMEEVERIKSRLLILNLGVHSINAPFSENLDISSLDEMQRSIAVSEIKKTVALCELLKAKFVVIHPSVKSFPLTNMEFVKKKIGQIKKSLNAIAENAILRKVKIACENPAPHLLGGYAEDLMRIIADFPEDFVGVCLDTGHANLIESPASFLKKVSSRLFTLHVSDNAGNFSAHLPPGDGKIDWAKFVSALSESDFDGVFMLEVLGGARFDDPDKVLKKSYEAAKTFLTKNWKDKC
ncbi:MAG: sugar phosphate isomerase/epimerase, partial [Elusimicrobia bacterium]|nr:sugar phosphate isomerase/epimerase [Elusimicrobiota bacterium]